MLIVELKRELEIVKKSITDIVDIGSALLAGAFASLLFSPIAVIECIIIEWIFSFFEKEVH